MRRIVVGMVIFLILCAFALPAFAETYWGGGYPVQKGWEEKLWYDREYDPANPPSYLDYYPLGGNVYVVGAVGAVQVVSAYPSIGYMYLGLNTKTNQWFTLNVSAVGSDPDPPHLTIGSLQIDSGSLGGHVHIGNVSVSTTGNGVLGDGVEITGSYTNQGTFRNLGSAKFTGSGTQNVQSNGSYFQNLSYTGTGTITFTDPLFVGGNFTKSGTGTINTGGNKITFTGSNAGIITTPTGYTFGDLDFWKYSYNTSAVTKTLLMLHK